MSFDHAAMQWWLTDTERELRGRLAGSDADKAALLAFAGIPMDEVERIDSFLGHAMRSSDNPASYLESNSAILVTSLAGRAARLAKPEDLWHDWWAGMGLPVNDAVAQRLPALANAALDTVGLATAEILGFDTVTADTDLADAQDTMGTVLLLHAGVQLSVMPLLMAALDDDIAAGNVVDSDALRAEFEADEAGDTPKALRELAGRAPGRALQLIDATAAFMAATHADPVHWESSEAYTPERFGLPTALYDAAREELRARPAGTPDRRGAIGIGSRSGRPQLYLDDELGVCVQLPRLAPNKDQWRITFGGTVVTAFRSHPSQPRTLVPITEATREVLVENADSSWRLPVIDSTDPLLVFARDGQAINDKVSLHATSANVVYPMDTQLRDAIAGTDAVLAGPAEKLPWPLWRRAELDLTQMVSLQATRPGVDGTIRSVSPLRKVTFGYDNAPLPGAASPHNWPVQVAGPKAVFPPSLSGRDELWHLNVAPFTEYGDFSQDALLVYELVVPTAGGQVDLLTDDDYPWIGEFVVRLINPRGFSTDTYFALAEGAHVEAAGPGAELRAPDAGGLSPVTVTVVHSGKEFYSEPAALRLGAADVSGEVSLSTDEGAEMTVTFTPPRLQFTLPMVDRGALTCDHTQVLPRVRLDVSGEFVILSPIPLRHQRLLVTAGEKELGEVPLKGNRASLPLRMQDVIGSDDEVRISFEFSRPGARRQEVELVRARPGALATGASRDGNWVLFDVPFRDSSQELAAFMWNAACPGHDAVRVEIESGEEGHYAAIPEEFGDSPLVVQPFLARNRALPPAWPSDSALVVPAAAGAAVGADAETGVDAAAALPNDLENLPGLWRLAGALRDSKAAPIVEAIDIDMQSLVPLLSENPRAGLAALATAALPVGAQPGLLITAGLATKNFAEAAADPAETDTAEPIAMPRRVPWLAALADLAALPAVAEQAEANFPLADPAEPAESAESAEPVQPAGSADPSEAVTTAEPAESAEAKAHRELLSVLQANAGDTLLKVLATGKDATLSSASIDRTSVMLTQLPAEQQRMLMAQIFDQHRMVPGPLTDTDARISAIHQVVTQRDTIVDAQIMAELAGISRSLFGMVGNASSPLRKAVNVRFHKLDGIDATDLSLVWTLVPATSLLVAVAARAVAHGLMPEPDVLDKVRPLWAQLADVAPLLVMSDLLVADAMVIHATHGDLTLD